MAMDTKRCPVCGMDAADATLTAEHLGIPFHFCSAQCRENFGAHPGLYVGKGALKAGGRTVLKRRTFTLARPVPDAEALRGALQRMMGVQAVDISGARVSVIYDLLEATAAQIEGAMARAGAGLGSGWAARLRRGWVRYTEQNELENLAAGDAPCCNRAPHG